MRSGLRNAGAVVPGRVALALGFLGLGVPVAVPLAAELPASATARIEQAVAVEAADPLLSFSSLEVTGSSGEVTLAPETASAGFTVTAAPHTAVTLTLAAAPLSGPGAATVLTEITHDAGSQPATDADGRLAVRLGAAVKLDPEQAAGVYSGTTQVIVNY